MSTFHLPAYLESRQALVETALARSLTDARLLPERLREAMRYSLLAGGKRIRPILVMAGAEAVGGTADAVMPCAVALEMIHTFSLVHDDLPAMDNDDLRRGVPTNHKQFGEAVAILAGDGLLAEAFWCLTQPGALPAPAHVVLQVVHEIADATGARGMTGGQALDIQAEQCVLAPAAVEQLHAHKTGALIRVAVVSGARLAGGSADQVARLARYGEAVGLAFQIADDLLSLEGTAEELGKPVGNDAARAKATFPAMAGRDAARARMEQLTAQAHDVLESFGAAAAPLRAIAAYITSRRK